MQILSGVFEGRTTGTPIGLIIHNTDQRSKDYGEIAAQVPARACRLHLHAEVRRARLSRRRPLLGARDRDAGRRRRDRQEISERALRRQGARLSVARSGRTDPRPSPGRRSRTTPSSGRDAEQVAELEAYMDALRKSGDSIGAEVTVVANGVPPGWGEPIFDRLDADIAHALMSINAAKGVEIGAGFESVRQKGTEHRDQMSPEGFLSNNAGGMLGGISSGQDVVARVAFKPTSSIRLGGQTVDIAGQPGRRDHQGPARPLRRHPRGADLRGDAGDHAAGSRPAPARPERRCPSGYAGHPAAGRLLRSASF